MKYTQKIVDAYRLQKALILTLDDLKNTIPFLWYKLKNIFNLFIKTLLDEWILEKAAMFYRVIDLSLDQLYVCLITTFKYLYKIFYDSKSGWMGLVCHNRSTAPGEIWIRTQELWAGSYNEESVLIIFNSILQNEIITISPLIFEKLEKK